jgi:chemotaxis protein histidine kinase CheA
MRQPNKMRRRDGLHPHLSDYCANSGEQDTCLRREFCVLSLPHSKLLVSYYLYQVTQTHRDSAVGRAEQHTSSANKAMKGLFAEARQPEVQATAFKFGFKLGGDEDQSDDDAQQTTTKKKKPNKKKKKKPLLAADGADGVDALQHHLSTVTLSNDDETQQPHDREHDADHIDSAAGGLSKSQKKNMKRKAKKTEEAQTNTSATSAPQLSQSTASTGATKVDHANSVTSKTSVAKNSKGPADSSNSASKPDAASPAKAVPKLSQTSKNTHVHSTASTTATTKEDWEIEIEKAIQENAKLAAQQRKDSATKKSKADASGVRSAGLSPKKQPPPTSNTTTSSSGAPHFLSAKDPELDDASKLRYKYGMGRNLVAIGPAKVRDPNWLPPPPGLTRQVPNSAGAVASVGAQKIGAAAADSSISNSVSSGIVGGSEPVGAVLGMAGAFSKRGAAKPASSGTSTGAAVSAASAEQSSTEEVSHSSPFSFSFGGL